MQQAELGGKSPAISLKLDEPVGSTPPSLTLPPFREGWTARPAYPSIPAHDIAISEAAGRLLRTPVFVKSCAQSGT